MATAHAGILLPNTRHRQLVTSESVCCHSNVTDRIRDCRMTVLKVSRDPLSSNGGGKCRLHDVACHLLMLRSLAALPHVRALIDGKTCVHNCCRRSTADISDAGTAALVASWLLSCRSQDERTKAVTSSRMTPDDAKKYTISKHKRFKRTLIYFDTDTQYANLRGNPLFQATKRHLNNR